MDTGVDVLDSCGVGGPMCASPPPDIAGVPGGSSDGPPNGDPRSVKFNVVKLLFSTLQISRANAQEAETLILASIQISKTKNSKTLNGILHQTIKLTIRILKLDEDYHSLLHFHEFIYNPTKIKLLSQTQTLYHAA